MRISDWSQTCALPISKAATYGDFGTGTHDRSQPLGLAQPSDEKTAAARIKKGGRDRIDTQTISVRLDDRPAFRSEEHTSELPSLMRTSYAVFCLQNNKSMNNKTRVFTNKIHHQVSHHEHN